MSDRERRVKDEAYRIWDEAGRPEGKGDEHWYEAEKRISAGESEPAPPTEKAKKPKSVKPVVQSAGASGVATPVSVANDAPKARPSKGATVDIAPAKPKKASKAAAEKPAKEKAEKDKPAKGTKPKSKG